MSVPLIQRVKKQIVYSEIDLAELIEELEAGESASSVAAFVKPNKRLKKSLTATCQRYESNAITPTYTFEYNPSLISEYLRRSNLTLQQQAELILSLCQTGIDFLDSKRFANAMSGIQINL